MKALGASASLATPEWAESSASACLEQRRMEPIGNTAQLQEWNPVGLPENAGYPTARCHGSPSEDRSLRSLKPGASELSSDTRPRAEEQITSPAEGAQGAGSGVPVAKPLLNGLSNTPLVVKDQATIGQLQQTSPRRGPFGIQGEWSSLQCLSAEIATRGCGSELPGLASA